MSKKYLAQALPLLSMTRQRKSLYPLMLYHMALARFFIRSSQTVSCYLLPTPPEPLPASSSANAQIEKEALVITWACERFSDYLEGMTFHVHTDHKPLVPLLGSKNLDELPLRVQRFKMRLMRFSFTISHVPGRDLTTADALSHAPVATSSTEDDQLRQDVQGYVRQ